MPRTPEQFEKIREGKRKQIMDTALELFAHDGYHSTSISKIAKAAGISKGLMYNYFESKEDLVVTIIEIGVEGILKHIDPNKDGKLTADEFDYYVDKTFDMLIDNTTYWRLYFNLLMQSDVYNLIKPKFESFLTETFNLLTAYYEKKGVKDPLSEAILFGAVMDGISMQYILNPEQFPLEKIKAHIIDKFGHK